MMELQRSFTPSKLQEAVKSISQVHLLYSEAAEKDYEEEISELLLKVEKQGSSDIKNRELEILLMALGRDLDESLKRTLMTILAQRKKKRLFEFCWILLQRDYQNPNLIEAMSLLGSYMEEEHRQTYQHSLLSQLELQQGDLPHQAREVLSREGGNLTDFVMKYQINLKSAFFVDLSALYFSECSKENFIQNKEMWMVVLKHRESKSISTMMSNYLESFEVLEYPEDVNRLMIKEYNSPGKSPVMWEGIAEPLKDKFLQWINVLKMESYFGSSHQRFQFWRGYHKDIQSVQKAEKEELLFIYFEGFTVVELGRQKPESYLYKKDVFEKRYLRYLSDKERGVKGWSIDSVQVIPAKAAIMDNLYSSIYRMHEEKVGILYTREIVRRALEGVWEPVE